MSSDLNDEENRDMIGHVEDKTGDPDNPQPVEDLSSHPKIEEEEEEAGNGNTQSVEEDLSSHPKIEAEADNTQPVEDLSKINGEAINGDSTSLQGPTNTKETKIEAIDVSQLEPESAITFPASEPETPKETNLSPNHLFRFDASESVTEEEEQSAFMKELQNFFTERGMEFKPLKFYGEGLNCLKLWRAVMSLGGYDKVTSCKLWRQVGESFKPPKTCTTVSWTFRGFYEKALLDYERHKIHGGELNMDVSSQADPMSVDNQTSGSGRARRDAAARAREGWHSQGLLGNGEEKSCASLQKHESKLKSLGLLKRKEPPYVEHAVKAARTKASKQQLDITVVDLGPPADWVKINVQKTNECFEVYALVPGLLREEVRVQSDPAGRLVISGEPENSNNPWGVTAFKKVVSLPARIDPQNTSAVVTLHGQLFVRVPFEQSE